MFVIPPGGWQRVALIVPLVLGVLLTAPGWLLWLFLPAKQRKDFLTLVGKLIEWARVIAGSTPSPPPRIDHDAASRSLVGGRMTSDDG